MTYKDKLLKFTMPLLVEKMEKAGEEMTVLACDTARAYCCEAGFAEDKVSDIINNIEKSMVIPDDITESQLNVLSLFILAATYSLAGNTAKVKGKYESLLDSEHILFEQDSRIGFKGSINIYLQCCDYEDDEIGQADADERERELRKAIGVTEASCSIKEYFENRVYLGDIQLIESYVEPDVLKAEFFEDMASGISTTIARIEVIYNDLFKPYYQVIEPVGILTAKGVLMVDETTRKLTTVQSMESVGIYKILQGYLNFEEVKTAGFDATKIIGTLGNSSPKLFFVMKMLEFLTGSIQENGLFLRAQDVASWKAYWDKYVVIDLTKMCRNVLYKCFESKGLIENKAYLGDRALEAKELRDALCNAIVLNVTPCLIAVSFRKSNTGMFAGFKFRALDYNHVIPSDVSKKIVEDSFGGFKGDSTATYEPIAIVGDDFKDYRVVDIQHKFLPGIINAEPLFAYRALRAQRRSGKEPSWKSVFLGKQDDDSILTIGERISFMHAFQHFIIAGSRSGKGVMTLNLLSAAIASRKPIFYLDSKPDMSALFHYMSDGKMFVMNGAHTTDKFEVAFGSPFKEDKLPWLKNLPDYMAERSKNYAHYAGIFYLRALMFVYSLIYLRTNTESKPELHEKLGGDDGIVIILDEFSIGADAIHNTFIKTGIIGEKVYSKNYINKSELAIDKGKGTGKEFDPRGLYNTDFVTCVNDFMTTLDGYNRAGFRGGESSISDVFIIGQELYPAKVRGGEAYTPTNDNYISGFVERYFWYNLVDFGPSDAYLGYNGTRHNYMDSAANSGCKSETRLNVSARNFAHVSDIDIEKLNKIVSTTPGSSRSIAETATYFKPFLILNDGDEFSLTVDKELRMQCGLACVNFDSVKDRNRSETEFDERVGKNKLEASIGFEAYIREQGAGDIQAVLRQSYDIANFVVKSYLPNYDGDCIDFIYDLRPCALFTPDSLLQAVLTGEHNSVTPMCDKYMNGGGAVGDMSSIDFSKDESGLDSEGNSQLGNNVSEDANSSGFNNDPTVGATDTGSFSANTETTSNNMQSPTNHGVDGASSTQFGNANIEHVQGEVVDNRSNAAVISDIMKLMNQAGYETEEQEDMRQSIYHSQNDGWNSPDERRSFPAIAQSVFSRITGARNEAMSETMKVHNDFGISPRARQMVAETLADEVLAMLKKEDDGVLRNLLVNRAIAQLLERGY